MNYLLVYFWISACISDTKYTDIEDKALYKIEWLHCWTHTQTIFLKAYREADHAYQISVRFTTKGCELAANAQFFEELKKILDNLISDLTCHIVESSYKCHSIKIQNQGLMHELFVTFQGNIFQRLFGSDLSYL